MPDIDPDKTTGPGLSSPPSPFAPAAPAPAASTVTLAVAYPTDSFDHGVAGAPALTREGVQVPASLVSSIEAAAKAAGVKVVQIIVDDAAKPVARFVRHVVSDVERI